MYQTTERTKSYVTLDSCLRNSLTRRCWQVLPITQLWQLIPRQFVLSPPSLHPATRSLILYWKKPEMDTSSTSVGSDAEREVLTPEPSGSSTRSDRSSSTPSPSPQVNYRAQSRAERPAYRPTPVPSFSSQATAPQDSTGRTPLSSPLTVDSSQVEYQRLLSNVIAAGRRKGGGFPVRGTFNMDGLLNALPLEEYLRPISYDLPFGVRTVNHLAHDMKVGAAGELYVSYAPSLPTPASHTGDFEN